jgi:YtcA family
LSVTCIYAAGAGGCDPIISIAGAKFPVWILCVLAGILVSVSLRQLFIVAGIDEWMTPRPLIYSCLALVVTFLCWLLAWR